MDFLNLLMSPLGWVSTGADTLVQWLGSCYSGTCASWPQTVWNNLGSSVESAASWLTSAAATVWTGILWFLPDGGTLPDVFHDSAQYMGNALASVDFILPVDALVYCMSLILAVKFALWCLHILRVIIGFVRGVGVDRYRF